MFHLLFTIIFLPFILLRALFGLLGGISHLLILPVKIFARHPIHCSIVIAALVLFFALKKDPRPINDLKANLAADKQAATKSGPKGAAPLIEPVTKIEDGDSAFATDTYVTMTDLERAAYSKAFYDTMSSKPDGEAFSWTYYNIKGSLRPTRTFHNSKGIVCRDFNEVLKVHQVQQTVTGIACDNGARTWCKLKSTATPECGLGYNPNFFQGVGDSVKKILPSF
ncbi:MAG: hypothetical protein ACOYNL_10145 [Rickettsiales bacterium]